MSGTRTSKATLETAAATEAAATPASLPVELQEQVITQGSWGVPFVPFVWWSLKTAQEPALVIEFPKGLEVTNEQRRAIIGSMQHIGGPTEDTLIYERQDSGNFVRYTFHKEIDLQATMMRISGEQTMGLIRAGKPLPEQIRPMLDDIADQWPAPEQQGVVKSIIDKLAAGGQVQTQGPIGQIVAMTANVIKARFAAVADEIEAEAYTYDPVTVDEITADLAKPALDAMEQMQQLQEAVVAREATDKGGLAQLNKHRELPFKILRVGVDAKSKGAQPGVGVAAPDVEIKSMSPSLELG